MRTRYIPWGGHPDLPQADRRWEDRPTRRRHGFDARPRARALAPGSGVLLPGRRRSDVRHGPLLPHRTGCFARPRQAGVRHPRTRIRPQANHQRAIGRHVYRRRSFHPRCGDTRLRERCDRNDSHQLRRVGLRDPLDGDIRHRRHSKRARPQHVQRSGSTSARAWRVGGGPVGSP